MSNNRGTVLAVCIGDSRKVPKKQVPSVVVVEDFGLKGDVHAGRDHKQVSLLSLASLEKNRREGHQLQYGDLFENIDFKGIDDLYQYPTGTLIKVGKEVLLSITQIGKDHDVDIVVRGKQVRSIMPKEGVFTRVVHGGTIQAGDRIEVIS